MVTFTIPGKPFAKQRAKATAFGGHARMYTPGATVKFEATVRDIALQHFPQPLAGAVRLIVVATFVPPKSWSKRKVAEHLHRPHAQKPDLDNCLKAISDGLNRVAFADDSQVAAVECRKVWGVTEQTVVTVEALA